MLPTAADLLHSGADVIWRCEVCRRIRRVDLARIVREIGPETVLANRRPPCRFCPGRVLFEIRRGPFTHSLDTIRAGSAVEGAYAERERARLIGLGFRVEMGKWIAPETQKGPAFPKEGEASFSGSCPPRS